MISLIMPFFNNYGLVHKRLYELWTYIPKREDFEILLINDASTEEKDYEGNIAWWQKTIHNPHKIRYHVNKKNLGFVGSMNLGAENADGDILIFFSDDVVISGDFVSEIREKIRHRSRILIGNRIVNWDGGWNNVNGKIIPYCEGWMLACTANIWNELGGFDPMYAPSDYEDVDLSSTALYKKIELVALDSKFLVHMGAATYGYTAERTARTTANREKWLKKWEGKWDDIIMGITT